MLKHIKTVLKDNTSGTNESKFRFNDDFSNYKKIIFQFEGTLNAIDYPMCDLNMSTNNLSDISLPFPVELLTMDETEGTGIISVEISENSSIDCCIGNFTFNQYSYIMCYSTDDNVKFGNDVILSIPGEFDKINVFVEV